MDVGLLDAFPILIVYFCIVSLILLFFELGFRVGSVINTGGEKDSSGTLGPMVGGLLGMLAFVLAFTFSMAASQHGDRKQNVLKEANAIGNAYLRAGLLVEPHATDIRKLLREYVDVRIQGSGSIEKVQGAITRSVEIHDLLWRQAVQAIKSATGPVVSLTISSVNEVIDMHQARLTTALHNRIPGTIWVALFIICGLTMMTMGTQSGLARKRQLVAVVPLALAFSALATLVVDLDRPQQGLIKVGQQSMTELLLMMDRDQGVN